MFGNSIAEQFTYEDLENLWGKLYPKEEMR